MDPLAQKAKEIFIALVDGTPEADWQRAAEEACQGDASLHQRVRALLAAHAQPDSRLDEAAMYLPQTVQQSVAITEQPGTVIGRYKLLEQIGEGGFGVVFMAEQQEPVRRKVALKIIKPGMDTKEVIARFEAERQALAILDHPHIAKVLDAGSTGSGRPFFVMELVRGMPITAYCDHHSLTMTERLELFVSVCQAVQHAHQKGIIHRDIKPSNVLVTQRDGQPIAKVIDFGVAKATNQRLTEKTVFTQFAQMVGTPLYMSPEQAGMSELDIDTRSDIYSLGVLLYELLTGATPFDRQRVRQAAYDELLRIIREEEPPPPSLRISTLGDTLPSVAAQRKTEPKKLSVFFRGELDWIVMKAIEKDRTRRYETASAFAADIANYMNDEVVVARPPSRGYQLSKFARRHRSLLSMLAVIFAALLIGFSSTAWQAHRAQGLLLREREALREVERQRNAAEFHREQARRQQQIAEANFERARSAVDQYLTRVSQEQLLQAPGMQALRKDLLELALRYYRELITEQADDPSLRLELAKAHARVSQIQGTLGSFPDSIEAALEAAKIFEDLMAEHPLDRNLRRELVGIYEHLGEHYRLMNDFGLSDQAFRSGLELAEGLAQDFPGTPVSWRSLGGIATLMMQRGDAQNAEPIARRFVERVEHAMRHLPPGPQRQECREMLVRACRQHGNTLETLNRLREAETVIQKGLVFAEQVGEEDDQALRREYTRCIRDLARCQLRQGKHKEALELLQKARLEAEKRVADNPHVVGFRADLGSIYYFTSTVYQQVDAKSALTWLEKSAAIFEDLKGEWKSVLPTLAAVYWDIGAMNRENNPRDAIAWFHKALSLQRELHAKHPEVVAYRQNLVTFNFWIAATYATLEEYHNAIDHFGQVIAIQPDHVNAIHQRAHAYWAMKEYDKAIADFQLSLQLRPDWSESLNCYAYLLATSIDQPFFDPDRAVEMARESLEVDAECAPDSEAWDPQKAYRWNTLGVAEYRAGNWKQAVEALKNCQRDAITTDAHIHNLLYLSMGHARCGELDAAREFLDKAMTLILDKQSVDEDTEKLKTEAFETLSQSD